MFHLPLRPNDRDRDRDRTRKASTSSSVSSKSKQHKHRSSHGPSSTRSPTKERPPDPPTDRSSTPSLSASNPSQQRRASMPGIDSASRSGTASFLESRTSLPYPTFSKAHSREAVGKPNIPTPDPTDLTDQGKEAADGGSHDRSDGNKHAPPSPPLTSVDQQSRQGSTVCDNKDAKTTEEKPKTKIRIRAESTRSSSSLRSKKDEGAKSSKTVRSDSTKTKRSSHDKESPSRTASRKSSKSKIVEETAPPKRPSSRTATTPPRSPATVRDIGLESTNGSEATTVAPAHQSTTSRKVRSPEKPPSRTQTRSSMSHRPGSAFRSPVEAAYDYGRPPTANSAYGAPPPPPPPPEVPISIPKVDYLLQHGGLDHRAPKSLLQSLSGSEAAPYPPTQPQLVASKIFEPLNRLLEDYQHVMTKNGSLAVATGYRSVARRLLDRLEAVFARDISSESCNCLMCEHAEHEERPAGVSWGEVLELVSGRRELPNWPPFRLSPTVVDPDWSGDEHIPMQKLDIDVPEEYREHYIRQSRKTKVAVDKWLSEQTGGGTSAPDEVDDETLTFAILTHLEPEERQLFSAILGISSTSPTPRPEGQPRPRPAPLVSSTLAIQRLYRLSSPPRDPETAIYMLNNPGMHHVLATLAAISDDEWDILISGRFDGFLRSGADNSFPSGSTPSRYSSTRSNTPFTTGGISRGPTPSQVDGVSRPASQPYGTSPSPASASFGGPIALDEEMEIAALAEIERDIYLGMEALEDAFEALHCKAEVVRRALRERGAGLSIANQNRRGSFVEARLGTPASGFGLWENGAADDDFFLDDGVSLAPDDSASNISSNRRRRPKRRTERRTPAPVEEEDEEEAYDSRRGTRRR
ncbi:5-Methylcytosine G/T mismatch-specific DNA glycosylase [Aspergillus japonicus CBS 114.51]|uniref:5-Methylcytosine G/T mismatch-specific DNA glycosylase n=1 Tax=Aspergillus japonicus CBS 114.51 TaxID=1448312 RepID=A0A8T8XFW4_ASPJA|nr:5-Methylcytosine G/T mismatch-specific DNA glycosylase [Aspergillus japonicus CBS 114.51]RAH87156.1 5-Methylcytosine G/T mismatch-specific DNA glycosylase [Aspergillus japonicus CBS 114.51]